MATDLSQNSLTQVITLLQQSNALSGFQFNETDVNLGEPQSLSGHQSGKNTGVLVSSKPNSRYRGDVPIVYNRLSLSGLTQYGELVISVGEDATDSTILAALNAAYGTNLSVDDVTITNGELVDYDGDIITFTAKAISLAWIGELSLVVKLTQYALESIIVNNDLNGLFWPLLTQSQVITFLNPSSQNFGTTPVITATSDSELPVELTSTTPEVCVIDGSGELSFLVAGQCTIAANQEGTEDFFPAEEVVRTFNVNAVPPGAPTNPVATAGDSSGRVTFTAPVFTGGSPILSYTAKSNPGNFTAFGPGSPLEVSGLTNATEYTFTVSATNVAGESVYSVSSNAIVPSAQFKPPHTWTATTIRGLGPEPSTMGLTAIATDDNGVWLAGGGAGFVRRSTDNGLTWTVLPNGLNSGGTNTTVNRFDTDGNGVWIAAMTGGWASRSEDNGETWSPLVRGLSTVNSTLPIQILATDRSGVWIAGFNSGYASKSIDNGLTWVEQTRGLNTGGTISSSFTSIATDRNGVWVVGRDSGNSSRSTNNGITWTALIAGLNCGNTGESIFSLATDRKGVWVFLGSGTPNARGSRSIDNGATWVGFPVGITGSYLGTVGFKALTTDAKGVWVGVGGAGNGGIMSTDNGLTWSTMIKNLNTDPTQNFYAIAAGKDDVWIAIGSNGWCARGVGIAGSQPPNTWKTITRGLGSVSTAPGPITVADGSGVWVGILQEGYAARSTNDGVTWTALTRGLNTGATTGLYTLATDRNGVWLAASASGYVSRSVDNGLTWSPLPQGLNSGSTTQIASRLATDGDGVWIAGFSSGYAARSVDNGLTWSPLPQGLNSGVLGGYSNIISGGDGVWISTTSDGYASRSIDNGLTWTPLTRGLGTGILFIGSMATDRNGVWVTALNNGYAARSVDNGLTWTTLPQGLLLGYTVTNLINSVATDTHGVWIITFNSGGVGGKSLDNGLTWTPLPTNALGGGAAARGISSDGNASGTWIMGTSTAFAARGTV